MHLAADQPSRVGVAATDMGGMRRDVAEVVMVGEEAAVEGARRWLLAGPARSTHSLHAAQPTPVSPHPSVPPSAEPPPPSPSPSFTHVTARFLLTDTTTTTEYTESIRKVLKVGKDKRYCRG